MLHALWFCLFFAEISFLHYTAETDITAHVTAHGEDHDYVNMQEALSSVTVSAPAASVPDKNPFSR